MNIAYFGLKIIYIIALFSVARQRNSLVSVKHHISRNVDLENIQIILLHVYVNPISTLYGPALWV